MNEIKENDLIPNPLSRDNTAYIFFKWTKTDLIFISSFTTIFSPIPITLFFTKFLVLSIIFLLIILLAAILFAFPLKNERLYLLIKKSVFNKHKNLKTEIKEIKTIDNLLIKNNEYIYVFQISGIDTDLLDEQTRSSLYSNLANLFQIENKVGNDYKSFKLLKMGLNNYYKPIKTDSTNAFIKSFELKNAEKLDEMSYCDNNKINKIFILLSSNKKNVLNNYLNEVRYLLNLSKLQLTIPNQKDLQSIKEEVFFENKILESSSRYFSIFDKQNKKRTFYRIFGIEKLPNTVSREWITSIFETFDATFITTFEIYDEKQTKKMIDKAVYRAKYEVSRNKRSVIAREQDTLNLEILEDVSSKIAESKTRFLRTNWYILIKADDVKSLNSKTNDLIRALNYVDIETNRFINEQIDAYYSIFEPNSKISKQIGYDILSETLGFGFPYQSLQIFDENSFLLGVDENNLAIGIDWTKNLNQEKNSNLILQGMSGSGKTTTAKQIITSQIAQKICVYVIDPENEYNELIKNCGGEIVDLSNPDNFINPFHFIKNEVNNLESQLLNNEIFFKFIFEDSWNINIKTVLMKSCNDLYLKQNEFIFSDLYKYIQSNYKEQKEILQILELYTKEGVYGSIWDKKTNIKLESDNIAFNFLDITNSYNSSYKEAKIFLLLKFLENKVIENRVSKQNKLVSIFIDEGHLFTNPKMQDVLLFIFNWFKRIRKYKGMITFSTQNINDILGNKELAHLTTAIFNNAFYLLFLKMSVNEIKQLDSLLTDLGGLSDREKEYLISAPAGNGILFKENLRNKISIQKMI